VSDTRDCDRCGKEFHRRTEGRWPERNHEWRQRRFCSRKCAFHYASASQGAELGRFAPKKAGEDSAEVIGSHALLVRCIKYGLAHDRHLGMGAAAFMERARELGLAA
jgi:hypothetical protein